MCLSKFVTNKENTEPRKFSEPHTTGDNTDYRHKNNFNALSSKTRQKKHRQILQIHD